MATQINSSDDIAILKEQSKALADGTIEAVDITDSLPEEENGSRHLPYRQDCSGRENVFWHLPLDAFLFFILCPD